MKELNFTVDRNEDGMILRDYLSKQGLSKTLVKKAKTGGISVSGETVTVRKILKVGDSVRIVLPENNTENIPSIDIPIKIVYEDDYLLVADKPVNMPTHPSRGNSLPTLANAVIARLGENFVFRAINRLDRDTCGLVLIAKDAYCAGKLSLSMKNREFTKKYIALVEGIPNPSEGIITAPIRREAENSIKRVVAEDGKYALTEYKVLETYTDSSLLEICLHTGRTHQIRVHLSYIGHPLIGDFLYGRRDESGYFLRCHHLSFPHPITGEVININV